MRFATQPCKLYLTFSLRKPLLFFLADLIMAARAANPDLKARVFAVARAQRKTTSMTQIVHTFFEIVINCNAAVEHVALAFPHAFFRGDGFEIF